MSEFDHPDGKHRNDDSSQAIAIIAQELRSPLMPIINAATVLRNTPIDEGMVRRAAGVIDRQARMLSRLVDDLLEVAISRTGRLCIRRKPTSMASIVDMCAETVAAAVADYGHQLQVDVAPQSMDLDADSFRVVQALKNVVLNAAQYSDRGRLIRILAARENGDAVVRVVDQGFGIDAAHLESIFDLYENSSRKDDSRKVGGLGVGLYLARYVAQAHGGTLVAKSDGVGRGSTFTLRLPCHYADRPDRALEEPSSRSDSRFTTA